MNTIAFSSIGSKPLSATLQNHQKTHPPQFSDTKPLKTLVKETVVPSLLLTTILTACAISNEGVHLVVNAAALLTGAITTLTSQVAFPKAWNFLRLKK